MAGLWAIPATQIHASGSLPGSASPASTSCMVSGYVRDGMLDVDYRPEEIYLSRIEIHPGHQGRGIGSRIISALLVEAEHNGQGPGSRRAGGQPSRASALPAARPDRRHELRRPRHQGHHAVRPSSEVTAGWIAAKVRNLLPSTTTERLAPLGRGARRNSICLAMIGLVKAGRDQSKVFACLISSSRTDASWP